MKKKKFIEDEEILSKAKKMTQESLDQYIVEKLRSLKKKNKK